MTQPTLPPGQGPIDPQGVFPGSSPPGGGFIPPGGFPPGWFPPPGFSPKGFPPGSFPPGGMPPYPQMMPPWMQPPRRLRIGTMLRLVVVLVIAGLILARLLNPGDGDESRMNVSTLVSGDAANRVAVVMINGLIDDGARDKFNVELNAVEKDSTVKALVVQIDTPGGSATASDEMYHRLQLFRKHMEGQSRALPIVISMQGMATSGGYYVACGGDYLIAERGALTGNIGVIFMRFNVSQFMSDHGLKEDTITATTSGHSFKNAGSMFHPTDPEDEKYLQGLVDNIFATFKSVVIAGRGAKLNDTVGSGDIFSGKAFPADEALKRGLIDQLGYPNEAYDYAMKKAGVANAMVVNYHQSPPTLLKALLGAAFGGPERSSVTVNGINVDSKDLSRLMESRPLLLWRGN